MDYNNLKVCLSQSPPLDPLDEDLTFAMSSCLALALALAWPQSHKGVPAPAWEGQYFLQGQEEGGHCEGLAVSKVCPAVCTALAVPFFLEPALGGWLWSQGSCECCDEVRKSVLFKEKMTGDAQKDRTEAW